MFTFHVVISAALIDYQEIAANAPVAMISITPTAAVMTFIASIRPRDV